MDQLEKLNQFTRREHTAQEVYLFDVILCDNEIDRDMECFSETALKEMQSLFIGKTGIFDHNLKSGGQTARIYDTELVQEPGLRTRDGRDYVALKAHAYMIRTDSNADLIREIEGGIKKEVSVSCSAAKRICSVCGADRQVTACGHVPGRTYGDKNCHTILDSITDAYEWSFVAVPAQRNAGVTKHFSKEEQTMDREQQYAQQEALLGEVEKQMRTEVLQLCGRKQSGAVSKALCTAADKMNLQELLHFKQELLTEQHGTPEVQLLCEDMGTMDAFCC
jgi:hypothetical protein